MTKLRCNLEIIRQHSFITVYNNKFQNITTKRLLHFFKYEKNTPELTFYQQIEEYYRHENQS